MSVKVAQPVKIASYNHTSTCNKQNLYLSATENNEGVLVYPVVLVKVEGVKCRALLDTGTGTRTLRLLFKPSTKAQV